MATNVKHCSIVTIYNHLELCVTFLRQPTMSIDNFYLSGECPILCDGFQKCKHQFESSWSFQWAVPITIAHYITCYLGST